MRLGRLTGLLAAAVGATGTTAGAAVAVSVPFAETFGIGDANWKTGARTTPAYDPAGQFISNSLALTNAQQILFRGHAEYDASADRFVGDWVAGGARTFGFSIRHDAPTALTFIVRWADPSNATGINGAIATLVQPNQWTDLSFDTVAGNPGYLSEGNSFNTVFSNVGNVQITLAGGQGTTAAPVTFSLDNVAITPEPDLLGLVGVAATGWLSRRRRSRAA